VTIFVGLGESTTTPARERTANPQFRLCRIDQNPLIRGGSVNALTT